MAAPSCQPAAPALPGRRTALAGLAALGLTAAAASRAWALDPRAATEDAPEARHHRVAMSWRSGGPGQPFQAGIVETDWRAGRARIAAALTLPGRAHGLLGLPDGGFLVLANRPGDWLMRCDAEGRLMRLHRLQDEAPGRSLNGHAALAGDGPWVCTSETETATQAGWVSLRDPDSLRRVAQMPSGGPDPHQLLLDAQGRLLVANGGILRDATGQKRALDEMTPSLALCDPRNSRLLDRWQLPDPRLSLRHLAWAAAAEDGMVPLGIALQAEHDTPQLRHAAPLLALWDGQQLRLAPAGRDGSGYAGDIAAGPGSGFVLSAQKQGRGLWWHPGAPTAMATLAELTDICALASWDAGRGVLLGAARGIARWHLRLPPRLVPWPQPMAPDNHMLLLPA